MTLDVTAPTAVWKMDQRKSERLVEPRQGFETHRTETLLEERWACERDDGWARVVAVEMEIGGGTGEMGGKINKTCWGAGKKGGQGQE